ncbi:hypothetical protein RD1_3691 [Roseobacter denitrificans OCh 114]|uniref:Uncharacterized protein n=1 Tax=Roseobacter denitrificans (strain ATCC 33942 / OCh 114) TaxID=375451 RepID=Q162D0_ROSDO|nr:hypothetical protein RD1_3691 [Roseobacter denitrificans OCh 114]
MRKSEEVDASQLFMPIILKAISFLQSHKMRSFG